jgi:GNAT superfamily N-acetyltransferase
MSGIIYAVFTKFAYYFDQMIIVFREAGMSYEFCVQSFCEEDLSEVELMIHLSVLQNRRGFPLNPPENYRDSIKRVVAYEKTGKGCFYVGKINGRIAATGGLDPEGMKDSNPYGLIPEIICLHVAPEHQGKGYGKAMLATLIGLATEAGYDRVQLQVADTQRMAINLFNKIGFSCFHQETKGLSSQRFTMMHYSYSIRPSVWEMLAPKITAARAA